MPALGLNSAWGTEDWSPVLIEALGQESSVALGGVRFIPTAGRVLHVPRVLIDPEAEWVAELEELPSDAGEGDTITLTPRKIGNVTSLSTEAIEDAPVNELDAVGRSLVRGVAKKLDTKFFSADAGTATAPAGILNGTLPGVVDATLDLASIVTGIGAVAAEGGLANVVWLSPADLTKLRLESMGSFGSLADLAQPGIERVAGAQLVMTTGLPAGVIVIADSRYVIAAVRRDARVDFSGHAQFSRDAVAARVTMRVDWKIADPNAVYVIRPT